MLWCNKHFSNTVLYSTKCLWGETLANQSVIDLAEENIGEFSDRKASTNELIYTHVR